MSVDFPKKRTREPLVCENEDAWIDAAFEDASLGVGSGGVPYPGFITYGSIARVPLIEHPGLTAEQNEKIRKGLQEVLLDSKLYNHSGEVFIAFALDADIAKGDFVKTRETTDSVPFVSDGRIASLLSSTPELALVSLHNHPDLSGVSIRDLAVFAALPNVRVLSVVNVEGEVSCICRERSGSCAAAVAAVLKPNGSSLTEAIDSVPSGAYAAVRSAVVDALLSEGCAFLDIGDADFRTEEAGLWKE